MASPAGGKDGGPQAAETTSIFQLPPACLKRPLLLLREPIPEGGTHPDALPCRRVSPLLEELISLMGTQYPSVGVSVLDGGIS